jgi:hypothetical protein
VNREFAIRSSGWRREAQFRFAKTKLAPIGAQDNVQFHIIERHSRYFLQTCRWQSESRYNLLAFIRVFPLHRVGKIWHGMY